MNAEALESVLADLDRDVGASEVRLPGDLDIEQLKKHWNCGTGKARQRAKDLANDFPERWAYLAVREGQTSPCVLRRLNGNGNGAKAAKGKKK